MVTPPVETGMWADHTDTGWKGALYHSQILRQELHRALHIHKLSQFSELPDKQVVSSQLTENWAHWEPQSTMMSPFLRPSPHPQDGGASASPPLTGSLPLQGLTAAPGFSLDVASRFSPTSVSIFAFLTLWGLAVVVGTQKTVTQRKDSRPWNQIRLGLNLSSTYPEANYFISFILGLSIC